MKHLYALCVLIFSVSASAQIAAVNGYCNLGGAQSVTSGLSSSNYLLGIIPSCTVTVYLTGTTTLATIYSDSSETALTNPFTANAASSTNPGYWMFFAAANQGYDVSLSGGVSPNVYSSAVTVTGIYPGTNINAGVSQLTGDVLAGPGSGSLVATVVRVNGASIPASATVLGTNSLSQLVLAATTGSGNVVLSVSPTLTGTITAEAANFSSGLKGGTVTFTNAVANQCVTTDVNGNLASTGVTCGTGASGGPVTSVGLSMPSIFSVSGSPITVAGTFAVTLASETANTVFAAPNGTAGTPSFRTLVAADIPSISGMYLPLTGGTLTGGLTGTTATFTGNTSFGTSGAGNTIDLYGSVSVRPTTTATSATNYNSNYLYIRGNYYNAGAINSNWSFINIVGSGASPTSVLTIANGDASETRSISMRYPVTVDSLANSNGVLIPSTASGYTGSGSVVLSNSPGLTGTLYGTSASFTSTSSIAVTGQSTSGYGGEFVSTSSFGMVGASTSNTGIYGSSLSGQGGFFTQVGTLTASTTSAVLYAYRNLTLGSYTSTGAIIRGEDPTASTGNLLELVKQGSTLFSVSSAGAVVLGGTISAMVHPLAFADMSGTAYTASQVVARYASAVIQTIPSGGSITAVGVNCTSSFGLATAATASTTFNIEDNGVSFGTSAFAASGTGGTVAISSAKAVARNDIISFVGPSTADSTAAGLFGSLCSTY